MRLTILLALLLLLPAAFAGRCEAELESLGATLPPDAPVGVKAAELLAAAVQLVEPALPPLVWSADVPLAEGEAGYEAVSYLAERRLLPGDWRPDALESEVWESMLSSFLIWYGLPRRALDREPEGSQLVADVAAALELVAESVRPVALVAADEEDRSRVAFVGVVWNWTVYPRLIVKRPDADMDLSRGIRPLLQQLSNCAVEVEHYVYAPEDTARGLFLSQADARMYVIGSDPELEAWPLLVPDGDEERFFAFSAPEVQGLAAYAAAFEGASLGVRSLLTMMPRLRTNLPPTRIASILQTPTVPQ